MEVVAAEVVLLPVPHRSTGFVYYYAVPVPTLGSRHYVLVPNVLDDS